MNKVTIITPATTANIGPGFDTIGCALSIYNKLTFETTDHDLKITGCPLKYQNKENLAYQAYLLVFNHLNKPVGGLNLTIDANIPTERGLGSSAAMIVAGALGANMILGNKLNNQEILELCLKLESHPDNIVPCLYGGLNASFIQDTKIYNIKYDISNKIKLCAFIPDFTTNTKQARTIIPKQVTLQESVFNISHLAVLLKALEINDKELINKALDDKLHQPYRRLLINQYEQLRTLALQHGAYGFFISGSGPTCIAIYEDANFCEIMRNELDSFRDSWQIIDMKIDYKGSRKVADHG